jgi:putative SOS response-associated peptidase YedK
VFICFSIQVDKNISKLSDYFGAKLSAKDAQNFQNLFKLQSEMDSTKFDSLLGIKHSDKKRSMPFKLPGDDGKVFSNYFTNVIVEEKDQRIIRPMRYRVRPHGSKEEIPSKFNVFNARLDSLENRQTWIPLFMKNHGIVPFTSFYEWVKGPDGKPKLISFYPAEREIMWAPVLYDEWISKDGLIQFKSFAIITDGPPPEIEKMGHDRCPIFLNEDQISDWLNPDSLSRKSVYEILSIRENVKYSYKWIN